MFKKLLIFLKNILRKTNNITWEYPLSEFSKNNNLYVLKDQNYKWVNVILLRILILLKNYLYEKKIYTAFQLIFFMRVILIF